MRFRDYICTTDMRVSDQNISRPFRLKLTNTTPRLLLLPCTLQYRKRIAIGNALTSIPVLRLVTNANGFKPNYLIGSGRRLLLHKTYLSTVLLGYFSASGADGFRGLILPPGSAIYHHIVVSRRRPRPQWITPNNTVYLAHMLGFRTTVLFQSCSIHYRLGIRHNYRRHILPANGWFRYFVSTPAPPLSYRLRVSPRHNHPSFLPEMKLILAVCWA